MSKNREFKKLLYLCNYPPCDLGGACIIMKQIFSHYDPDRLNVVCDGDWLTSARAKCPESLIHCRHESVPNRLPPDLRPRRFWGKVRSILNLRRADEIFATGKSIIEEQSIEAIMLPLYCPEFAIAGYRLHKAFGIPFFVWESDDWDVIYKTTPLVRKAVSKLHPHLLREARRTWMTSHNMIAHHREQFGVDGQFLFNFVDMERFRVAAASLVRREGPLQIVYTGAINEMFASSMKRICGLINRGLVVGGRPVQLTIYTNCETRKYTGSHVRSGGFVTHAEIPRILADADVLLVAVAFAESSEIMKMVRTSLYTKTIEYLAAGRPILYFGPSETAQYAYFSPVMKCVTNDSSDALTAALVELANEEETTALCKKGRQFVMENHSLEAMQRNVLDHFYVE
jgi:glycosyltransferase involved in cell wall biosynthesis